MRFSIDIVNSLDYELRRGPNCAAPRPEGSCQETERGRK